MDKQTEYVESLSAQIVEWDSHIDRLKDQAESAASGTKTDHSAAIEALQLKRDKAARELQRISTTSDDEWQDVKTGADRAMGEVRTMLRDTITKIT